MNKPVILLGSGGHAKVLLDILHRSRVKILGIVDPHREPNSLWSNYPVLGHDNVVYGYAPDAIELINGIGSLPGDLGLRQQIYLRFKASRYQFKTVIDPLAFIATEVLLAEGVQIMAGAIIQPGVSIGVNSIINSGSIIEHDCQLGSDVHMAPGVVLSGGVSVGNRVHMGTGSSVIQNICIGDDSIIGAGAVVTRNIKNHQIVYPARSLIQDKA